MLWLNHPKPDGQHKPVAMLLRRERLRHEGSASGYGQAGAAMDPDAEGAPEPEVPALQLTVRYSLTEYIGFTWQHCGYLIRRRRIGALPTWWLCSKSTASAALHFVLQGRSRRTYEFTIDTHGIVRSSGSGVTLVPWRDVSAIRRYARGYMLVLARGTLPIPFRCLDRRQMAAMEAFAALVRAAARA